MKKFISVLLSLLMIFSLCSVGVSAADASDELKIAVANDLHYNKSLSAANYNGTYTTDFANAVSSGQLKLENELIIDEFLSRVAQSDSEAVLIPGDITDKGIKSEQLYIAEKFAEFEKTTGKQIFVVPGNHDYYGKLTAEDFKKNFADFGYSQAVAVDSATASYAADLNDEYRVLSIDATDPGQTQGYAEEIYDFVQAQAIKAQAEGKKLIAMCHYNLLEHLVLVETVHKGSILGIDCNFPELFAKYNIKYTFTGHTHDHDIAEFTGSNGVTVYDVLTGTLNAHPCPYREVSFGEKVKITTKFIDKIDTSSLKGKITDATYTLATESFPTYTEKMIEIGYDNLIRSYVSLSKIKSLLKLDAEKDAQLISLIEGIFPLFNEAINMPIYKSDETEKGKSLEAIGEKYDLEFPEGDYNNFIEFATEIYLAHGYGDENNGILSDNYKLLTSSLTAILIHTLEGVTAEQYATLMSMACSLLGADMPVDFFVYAGSGLKKAQGIEIFVTAVASPLLLEFTTDIDPADNNVTLDGYAVKAEEPKELTFWEKIVDFFKGLISYIMRILGF